MNSKTLTRIFVALLLTTSISTFASDNQEEYTPYVNSISVTGGQPLMRTLGTVTLSLLSGDCTLAIGASADIQDVPTSVRGMSMKGIVVSVRPVVTECSSSRIGKMLSASASLDQLVKTAMAQLPVHQTQGLPVIVQLPQLR